MPTRLAALNERVAHPEVLREAWIDAHARLGRAERVALLAEPDVGRPRDRRMDAIPRPRDRTQIIHQPAYYAIRNHLVEFLVKRSKTFRAKLRGLGVLSNKHIPLMYLRASAEQRRALLQGILDTDGAHNGSAVVISQTNLRLAADIVELARSLGFKPTSRLKTARVYDRGEIRDAATARTSAST